MGGVLVDDNHRATRLRDDVGLVQLGARSTQRAVEQVRIERGSVGGRVGARLVEARERRLHGLAEAARRERRLRRWKPLRRSACLVVGRTLSQRLDRLLAAVHRGAVARRFQRVAHGVDDERADFAAFAETDFRLGGMHVDVDGAGGHVEEQREQGMAALGHQIAVGGADGAEQQTIAHGALVDEQKLLRRVVAMQRRQGCKPCHRVRPACAFDGQRVVKELAAHDAGKALELAVGAGQRTVGGITDRRLVVGDDLERHVGVRHREALDHFDDGLRFGALGAHEFEARGCGREQLAHLDDGTRIEAGGADGALGTAIDDEAEAFGIGGARGDREAGDGADRWQRLAAKPERGNIKKIIVGELRGGVPFDGEGQIGAAHA